MKISVSSKSKTSKPRLSDSSLWSLVITNVFVIFLAQAQDWSLITLMWAYWCQSVIIGLFSFIRLISLKDYSVEGVMINNRPMQKSPGQKIFLSVFFLFHYGFFHAVYLVFLVAGSFGSFMDDSNDSVEVGAVAFSSLAFFANHLYSAVYNSAERNAKPNIGKVMMVPYARILPMHLTFILGGLFFGSQLLAFLVLKTIADALGHIQEHRVYSGVRR